MDLDSVSIYDFSLYEICFDAVYTCIAIISELKFKICGVGVIGVCF